VNIGTWDSELPPSNQLTPTVENRRQLTMRAPLVDVSKKTKREYESQRSLVQEISKFKHCSVTSDSDFINEHFINHTSRLLMFDNDPKSTVADGVFSPELLMNKAPLTEREPMTEVAAETTMRTLENVKIN
jgi:hypothetical protein